MNKPTLEELLRQLRQEAELISMEEVRTRIMSQPVNEKVVSRKSQLLKWTIMTTGIIITGILAWFSVESHQPKENLITLQKPTAGATHTFEVNAPETLNKRGTFASDTVKKQIRIQEPVKADTAAREFFLFRDINDKQGPRDSTLVFNTVIAQGNKPANPCRPRPEAFAPDSATLRNLGIVMSEGTLVFEQQNTIYFGDLRLVIDGVSAQHSINGTNMTLRNILGYGNKLVPDYITDCRGIERFNDEKAKNLEEDDLNLICVMVTEPNVGDYYQFWYRPHKELLQILGVSGHEKFLHVAHVPPFFDSSNEPPQTWIPKYWAKEEQSINAGTEMREALGIKTPEGRIELNRDGISLEYKGYYASVNIRFNNVDYEQQLKETNSKKVMPLFVSELSYTDPEYDWMSVSSLMSTKPNRYSGMQEFLTLKDKLIAVQVDGELPRIFWYAPSPAIKALLDEETLRLVEAYQQTNKAPLPFKYGGERPEFNDLHALLSPQVPEQEALRALQLSPASLKALGLEVLNGEILHHQYYAQGEAADHIYNKKYSVNHRHERPDTITSPELQEKWIKANKNLWFITDDLGSSYRLFSYHSEKDMSLKDMVPVLVRSGAGYTVKDRLDGKFRPDLIFWYEPTEEFLSLLPADVAADIRKSLHSVKSFKDLQVIPAGVDSASCKYVEACKNRKGAITDYKLYPNPAGSHTTLELDVPESMTLELQLFSLDGSLVKTFDPFLVSRENNKITIETGTLVPGIYLLQVRSDKGDAIHERLVVVTN